jgi:hypothetical protein
MERTSKAGVQGKASRARRMKWKPTPRSIHLCVDMQILFSEEGP